ncbi:IGR protein motif [Phaffia rhodozyma]|uniref:Small ribosomal subunit protein mS41 n=1 Tax=Phaffia rhodozyma TaxID=264483 RepID=A0A0F7SSV7_PHARH|nr:IGR protein motif [Phaffia rhodozyma]
MSLSRHIVPLASSSRLVCSRSFHTTAPVALQARSTKIFKHIDQAIREELPPVVIGSKVKRQIPEPKGPITDPAAFFRAAGRNLKNKVKGEVTWDELFTRKAEGWTQAGLVTKDVKYVQWITEKYRQGFDPRFIAREPKKPKKIRGHGLAIQNGIRMKWSFKMDLAHAPRPWGMEAFASRGKPKD